MEAIVEESTKAISQLTMSSSSSSSSGAPSKKAMKRVLKMKHKEEETRIKDEKRGGPKDKLKNKTKGFGMEEEEMAKAKGPFDPTTTTTATATAIATASASSSHQSRIQEAMKRELKVKHKEEERGGPKDKQKNKNKGFHMEEMVKPKGPFEVYDGLMNNNGEMIPFDQARVILFKEYKERAEARFGHPLTRFVVIIPPNSCDARLHKMIRDAARTAGLDLKRIIVKGPYSEEYPYGLPRRDGDPITTLDFSGPTYGINVDDYRNIPGICYQGSGTVFDNRLDQTVEYMKLVHGVDFTEDPSALQNLSEALEKGSATKTKVMIKLPAADGDDQITERTVTLRDF